MEEAVDAAEVNEDPVVGDVLHRAGHDRAFLQVRQGLVLEGRDLRLEHHLAGEHDVGPAPVEVDDLGLDLFADVVLQAARGPEVHEGTGQERAHADVHREPALDPLDDLAPHGRPITVGGLEHLPDADLGRALTGEPDIPHHLVEPFHQDVHLVTRLDRQLAVAVGELGAGDDPFRLETDVHHDVVVVERDDGAANDVALAQMLEGLLDELPHLVAADGALALLLSGRDVVLLVVLAVNHLASSRRPGRGV